MKFGFRSAAVLAAATALFLTGCAGYSWKSRIPADARTVFVPTFANESQVTRLGSETTRQLLREFQREGTLKIVAQEDAALEVQGIVTDADSHISGYNRKASHRNREYRFAAECKVSVIDKRTSRVLVNDRKYRAETTFVATNDRLTGERDASGRLAEEFARQIADDVLNMKL